MTSVTETTDRPPQGEPVTATTEIPDVITWALGIVTHQSARARKVESDIAEDNGRLGNLAEAERRIRAEFEQKVAEIEAQRGPILERLGHAERELMAVRKNAEVAHEMAARACDTHGWDLPLPPADVAVKGTGMNPILTAEQVEAMNQTRPDFTPCRFCGKEIKQVSAESWIHTADGAIYCAGSETTYAEPDKPAAEDGPAGNTKQVPSVFFEGDPEKQQDLGEAKELPVSRTGGQPSVEKTNGRGRRG